jgi:hypothetical protein
VSTHLPSRQIPAFDRPIFPQLHETIRGHVFCSFPSARAQGRSTAFMVSRVAKHIIITRMSAARCGTSRLAKLGETAKRPPARQRAPRFFN